MSTAEQIQTMPFFDERIQEMTVYVLPGHHFAQASGSNSISTLLGSCVAVCLRDRRSEIGGLNHFLLPGDEGDPSMQSARYGVYAMEMLINSILKMGAMKANLEAKIFGGAKIISTSGSDSVGSKNCDFVKDYLATERIPVTYSDVGGSHPRRVYFFPATGESRVLEVNQKDKSEVSRSENKIKRKSNEIVQAGAIELF